MNKSEKQINNLKNKIIGCLKFQDSETNKLTNIEDKFNNPEIVELFNEIKDSYSDLINIPELEKKIKNKTVQEQRKYLKQIFKQLEHAENGIDKSSAKIDFYEKFSEKLKRPIVRETLLVDTFLRYKNKEYPKGLLRSNDLKELKENIKKGKFDINIEKVLYCIENEKEYIPTEKEYKKAEEEKRKSKEDSLLLADLNFKFDYLDSENSDIEEYDKLIARVEKCLGSKFIINKSKALLCRRIGETYLKNNKKKESLNYFEKALKYNEKVGVKRLYNKLKKELG